MKTIAIHTEQIALDQALKKEGIISTGGEMAPFLEIHRVLLNGKPVFEKRKKLYIGDILTIDQEKYTITAEPGFAAVSGNRKSHEN